MFKSLGGLPPDVMAIEAIGNVTHDDYRSTLIPKAEAMMAKGPIRTLYVIGEKFTGFGREALWDDTVFGFKHWHDFIRIAEVTDHDGCEPRSESGCSRGEKSLPQKTGSPAQKSGCVNSNTRTPYRRNEGKTGS